MTKTHIKELVESQPQKVIATFWWDGKKVQANPANMLMHIDDLSPNGKTIKDGPEFLDALAYSFRNGYMFVRNKPDEV